MSGLLHKPMLLCEWTEDPDTDRWNTTCDRSFSFISDGPRENKYLFCPGCGRRIKVKT
jgi:hypothetical protein